MLNNIQVTTYYSYMYICIKSETAIRYRQDVNLYLQASLLSAVFDFDASGVPSAAFDVDASGVPSAAFDVDAIGVVTVLRFDGAVLLAFDGPVTSTNNRSTH